MSQLNLYGKRPHFLNCHKLFFYRNILQLAVVFMNIAIQSTEPSTFCKVDCSSQIEQVVSILFQNVHFQIYIAAELFKFCIACVYKNTRYHNQGSSTLRCRICCSQFQLVSSYIVLLVRISYLRGCYHSIVSNPFQVRNDTMPKSKRF